MAYTFDPTKVGHSGTLSGDNLVYTGAAGGNWASAFTTGPFLSTGKFFFEITVTTLSGNPWEIVLGVANSSFTYNDYCGQDTNAIGEQSTGNYLYNGGSTSAPPSYNTAGLVIQVCVDFGAKTVWVGNPTLGYSGGGTPGGGTGGFSASGVSGNLTMIVSCYSSSTTVTANFGASSFSNTAPSGFSPWNSAGSVAPRVTNLVAEVAVPLPTILPRVTNLVVEAAVPLLVAAPRVTNLIAEVAYVLPASGSDLVIADRVQETTTTTGTGTLALLGAVAQYQTFLAGIGNTNTTYYTLLSGNGTDWEVGLGQVVGATLLRLSVLASSSRGSLISTTGTSTVFCTIPAAHAKLQ